MPTAGASCDCRALPDQVNRLWAAGPYEGWLRSAVYSFKFNGETARTPQLAALLTDACAAAGRDVALVPVPLHPKRKRQRGYDQTALLAHQIGKETRQSIYTGLAKVRETPHQVGLTAAERSLNLLDAFVVQPGGTAPQHVMLIDDVATTGATLTECAIALRKGGAVTVSAVVIAHGL
jgi:ComF family protein